MQLDPVAALSNRKGGPGCPSTLLKKIGKQFNFKKPTKLFTFLYTPKENNMTNAYSIHGDTRAA